MVVISQGVVLVIHNQNLKYDVYFFLKFYVKKTTLEGTNSPSSSF